MAENWLNLSNQIVIVTGGSSGIGESIVKELLTQGVKVVNADIHSGKTEHENLFYVKTDVSSKADIDNLVQKVTEKYGKIDGLVNNAGINIPKLLVDAVDSDSKHEADEKSFDKMLNINQKGLFLLSQAVGKIFVNQKYGVIINMSSESGLEGSEGQSIYAATKAALNSFTRSWAKELGKYNIRVVGVAPGIMEETGLRTIEYETALSYTRGISIDQLREGYSKTTVIPLSRSGKLHEVANFVCYLLSEKASYITGVTYNISGGKTRG